jgi:hypothetical protein
MGWTYSHRPRGQGVVDWLKEELPSTFANVVDTRQVGNVIYALYEIPEGEPGYVGIYEPCADGRYRALLIFLIGRARDHYNTGYKDMDEGMGPVETTCPAALLDRASPIREGVETYARAWRQKCREHATKDQARGGVLVPGALIQLERSPEWNDGHRGLRYTVELVRTRARNSRRTTLLKGENGMLYRLPQNFMDYGPTIAGKSS